VILAVGDVMEVVRLAPVDNWHQGLPQWKVISGVLKRSPSAEPAKVLRVHKLTAKASAAAEAKAAAAVVKAAKTAKITAVKAEAKLAADKAAADKAAADAETAAARVTAVEADKAARAAKAAGTKSRIDAANAVVNAARAAVAMGPVATVQPVTVAVIAAKAPEVPVPTKAVTFATSLTPTAVVVTVPTTPSPVVPVATVGPTASTTTAPGDTRREECQTQFPVYLSCWTPSGGPRRPVSVIPDQACDRNMVACGSNFTDLAFNVVPTQGTFVLGVGDSPVGVVATGVIRVQVEEHMIELPVSQLVGNSSEILLGRGAFDILARVNGGDGCYSFDPQTCTATFGNLTLYGRTEQAAGASVAAAVPPVGTVTTPAMGEMPAIVTVAETPVTGVTTPVRRAVDQVASGPGRGTWRSRGGRTSQKSRLQRPSTDSVSPTVSTVTVEDGPPTGSTRPWPENETKPGKHGPRPGSSDAEIKASVDRGRAVAQHHLELTNGSRPSSMASDFVGSLVCGNARRVRGTLGSTVTNSNNINVGDGPTVDFHLGAPSGVTECGEFPRLSLNTLSASL
jgi:hypothetical protein